MSSDDALAARAATTSVQEADRAALMRRADGFVVVSWWQDRSGGTQGVYEYEHRPTLNDALDTYREYEDGEHARARAIGIFAALHGLPVISRLEPAELLRLMRETRRGA